MVGELVIQGLQKLQGPITRDALLSTMKQVGTFDLGGVTLSYGPEDNQGMDQVFLTVIRAGCAVQAGRSSAALRWLRRQQFPFCRLRSPS